MNPKLADRVSLYRTREELIIKEITVRLIKMIPKRRKFGKSQDWIIRGGFLDPNRPNEVEADGPEIRLPDYRYSKKRSKQIITGSTMIQSHLVIVRFIRKYGISRPSRLVLISEYFSCSLASRQPPFSSSAPSAETILILTLALKLFFS